MSVTIFEGPDGGGKTTLIETMERMMGRREHAKPVRVNHGPYIGELSVANRYLASMITGRGDLMHPIMDRSWISEAIYGPLMRGENRISVAQRRALERFALGCGAITVLCLPSYEACRDAYLKRRPVEYLPDESMLRQVYDKFAEIPILDDQPVPSFLYNYEREDSRVLYLDMLYEIRSEYKNHGPGVGLFMKGTTLVIGEQLSTMTAAAPYPWISWDQRGCVGWLSEQLEEWGVSERDLYWINALDHRGREIRPSGWLEQLSPKRVIALGQIASAWASKHQALLRNSKLHDYPHPQHWKRFHHNEPYMLREVFVK